MKRAEFEEAVKDLKPYDYVVMTVRGNFGNYTSEGLVFKVCDGKVLLNHGSGHSYQRILSISKKEGLFVSDRQDTLFPDTRKELPVLQGLDRSEVEPLAFKILGEIEPFCLKAEIAGSIRRRRGVVNDVDIVVLPRPGKDDSWLTIIKTVRSGFDASTVKQGDKLAVLNVPFASKEGYVQVDLYRAEPDTWGILLLVRTGSKEHNVKLCNLAISKGLRLKYSVGLTDQRGLVVAGRTEEEVFAALGLPFIPPGEREVLYNAWISNLADVKTAEGTV